MMLSINKITKLSLHENIRENDLKLYNEKYDLLNKKILIHRR